MRKAPSVRRPSLGSVVGRSTLLVAAVAGLAVLAVRGGDERLALVDPVRNGSIVHGSHTRPWPDESGPRLAGAGPYPVWTAFDQRTDSFLFLSKFGRVFVVGQDTSKPVFDCDHPWPACDLIAFGPGPDEVTVPVDDPGGLNFLQSVRIVALDGTVRDELDLTAAVMNRSTGQPQLLTDLAWSPDGSRLAVSTEPEYECDPGSSSCEGEVWFFERDGGRPQPVFTQRASGELVDGRHPSLPVLRELAWSPRGHSLALVVGGSLLGHVVEKGAWPRLVALRFLLGRRVRTDTLHVYDDRQYQVGPDEYAFEFGFAWSPDGSRIAVLTGTGVAEISSEDGRVLARHPRREAQGPLAWLREP